MIVPLLGAGAIAVSWLAYRWGTGRRRRHAVEAALQSVRPVLTAVRGERGEPLVAAVFWYGAVDIAPEHLIIWVLLQDGVGSKVPPWFVFDETDQYRKLAGEIDPALLERLRAMRQTVHDALHEHGWNFAMPNVGFEWERRVKEGGGFFYFK